MKGQPTQQSQARPRDAQSWAAPGTAFKASEVPEGAINVNLEGHQLTGPMKGFGPMWRKTYRMRLPRETASPAEVIKVWKENFPSFWPLGNHFYAPLARIAPGDQAILNLTAPGGMVLSTGIMVIYADEESFTFMTPEGHMLAGWITFSAFEEGDSTVVQAQALIRSADPLMEIGLRLGGHNEENTFWQRTLESLARYFGVSAQAQTHVICVDPRIQWSAARNVRHTIVARSMLYMISAPVRLIRKRAQARRRQRVGSA